MHARILWGAFTSLTLLLALLVTLPLGTSATPTGAVGTENSAAITHMVSITDAVASVDQPGHHFGFSQASVLAQITSSQAQPVLAGLGYTGVVTNACASLVGQSCTVSGPITGNATIMGSARWTITVAAAPAGALAGGIPQSFALTTVSSAGLGEGPFPCSALAGGSTTCTFTTTGNPLVGTTVAACFPPAAVGALPLCVVGSVTGTGVVPPVVPVAPVVPAAAPFVQPPLLPPPPVQFIAPLLPPPPPPPPFMLPGVPMSSSGQGPLGGEMMPQQPTSPAAQPTATPTSNGGEQSSTAPMVQDQSESMPASSTAATTGGADPGELNATMPTDPIPLDATQAPMVPEP